MSESQALIVGEFSRNLDERFRLTLPDDLLTVFQPKDGNCVLAKEGAGHLSLWDQEIWQEKME
ncbi:MAG: MraZ N-terminal domain containing protein, partial [Thermoguttaceae bacterium]|nr:MraZ N-terminal domain containing protein [Thermoguttaceae bacterium]